MLARGLFYMCRCLCLLVVEEDELNDAIEQGVTLSLPTESLKPTILEKSVNKANGDTPSQAGQTLSLLETK